MNDPITPRPLLGTTTRRRLRPMLMAWVALGIGCSENQSPVEPLSGLDEPTQPAADTVLNPFPDSVKTGQGLPPGVTDSLTNRLGGDTLVQGNVVVFPAYSVRPDQVAPGDPTQGPMQLAVRVLARDTAVGVLRRLPIRYAACPLVLRLHRSDDRLALPVWRSNAAGAASCPPPFRANESRGEIMVVWSVPDVLGDSLPAGRYAFSFQVRLADGRELEYQAGSAYLTADSRAPSRDLSALQMRARSQVVGQGPRVLRTTVTLVNMGDRTLQFEHGACTPELALYRTSERTGRPAWRTPRAACIAILLGKVLAPGDSVVFTPTVPLHEVLGDSLEARRYYVTAELELLNDDLPVERWASRHRIHAGAVDLPRVPDPLPAARIVGDLAYASTTRLVRGSTAGSDTLRTLVQITNTAIRPVQTEIARDCPVIVYLYRSAAARDSVPLQEPAWRSSQQCRLYTHRFQLEPGQSWVLQHDLPVSEISSHLGLGRYYFTALLAGTPRVTLAAGDVEIGV